MRKNTKNAGAEKTPAKKTRSNKNQSNETTTQKAAEAPMPIAFEFSDEGVACVAGQEPESDDQSELTEREQEEFAEAETVIEKGLDTFKVVGAKLREIRDNMWYRKEYGTFQEYCQKRWHISRTHAYRLMDASEVAAQMSPNGDKASINYAQATVLAGVAEENRHEVLDKARREAGDKAPTGKQVKQAAAKVLGKKSAASKLKVVEPDAEEAEEPVEDADREGDQDQDQDQGDSAEDDDEQEKARPRPKVSLVKILELLEELSDEVEGLENSSEACSQIRQIRTFLKLHCPQSELQEAA